MIHLGSPHKHVSDFVPPVDGLRIAISVHRGQILTQKKNRAHRIINDVSKNAAAHTIVYGRHTLGQLFCSASVYEEYQHRTGLRWNNLMKHFLRSDRLEILPHPLRSNRALKLCQRGSLSIAYGSRCSLFRGTNRFAMSCAAETSLTCSTSTSFATFPVSLTPRFKYLGTQSTYEANLIDI